MTQMAAAWPRINILVSTSSLFNTPRDTEQREAVSAFTSLHLGQGAPCLPC